MNESVESGGSHMNNREILEEWIKLNKLGVEYSPKVTTMAMDYDTLSPGLRDTYDNMCDYVRYRGMELMAEQLAHRKIQGAIAEAGVDMGLTSAFLNRLFPDRKLYLYDTFDSFPENLLDIDIERFDADPTLADNWAMIRPDSDTRIRFIREHLTYEEMVYFRKGIFPDTALRYDIDETFAFVLLDMDLYQSTLEGIRFFYPRLASNPH